MVDTTQSQSPLSRLNIGAWGVTALLLALVALLDWPQFIPTVTFAAKALAGTAPFILFAVFAVAYLKASGAENLLARAFEGNPARMIVMAALFGGLAPFCSCEVIPFVAGLLALGAPLSAVMAFWLASPLVDPPTILITAGALGWDFAIGKTIAAVGIGLMGGFGLSVMLRAGLFANPLRTDSTITSCGCGPDPFSQKPVPIWDSAELS